MNRKFRGRSQHRGRGRFFHNARRNFTSSDKPSFPRKNMKSNHCNDVQIRRVPDTMIRLKEKDVGITEYISEHAGFSGIIKQRYGDFHVNEIDCDGNIVTLTSIAPPDIKVEQPGENNELEEHLKSVVSPEVFEKIKGLVDETTETNSVVEIEVTKMSKDDRRILHCAIKAVGGEQLVSNTKDKEDNKFIVIRKHSGKKSRLDRRTRWPTEYGGDYVHFVLHKENLDTMETVNFLAGRLRIRANRITYAGTKDRRGITSQNMSIYHVEPKKLVVLSSNLRGISLGNYSFKTKGLKLGDLQGNRFHIVLRNVTGSDEQIEEAMKSLCEQGFLNYYGLQRFGSAVSVPTHAIGKALLQGDWKLAIELILKPRDGEGDEALAKARKIWWETRDAVGALKVLPNRDKFIEGKLLLGLSQCKPNDYVNALEKVPRNTRLLYLHSYQSLVWNKVVSRRVRELGLKPIVGDLIFLNDTQTDVTSDIAIGGDPEIEENESPEAADNSEKKNVVKVVTEDDIARVHIHDIVMPLPGHDVVYPENMKEWYEDILKSDGLTSASLKQTVRKYSVSGAYRKMVIRPDNLSWRTMHYSDPIKALVLSDKDKMKNTEPPKDEPDGTYKALILEFCLPSSTYATMALREVLKSDTSSEHQASLNNYHTQKDNELSSSSSVDSAIKQTTESRSTELEIPVSIKSELSDESNELRTENVCKTDNESKNIDLPSDSMEVKDEEKMCVSQNENVDQKKDDNVARKREMEDVVETVEEKKIKLDTN